MPRRIARSIYVCSVCKDELDVVHVWITAPNWIGTINHAFCDRCERNVTLLRDESGKFIGTQASFTSPFTDAENFFRRNVLENVPGGSS